MTDGVVAARWARRPMMCRSSKVVSGHRNEHNTRRWDYLDGPCLYEREGNWWGRRMGAKKSVDLRGRSHDGHAVAEDGR